MESVGYLYLIEHYNLDVCELLQKSYVTNSSEKTIAVNDESSSTYYPVSRYKIDWTWEGQIKFALKNEGVNLEVLKAFLSKIPQVELIDFTFIVERFLKIVEQTIKFEWAAELNYLSSYDATKRQMREVVDMPDEDVNRMMRFVCQNRGMLGEEKRRKFFPRLNDEQVSAFEAIIRRNLL